MAMTSTNFSLTQPNYPVSASPGPYRSEQSLFEPNFLRLSPPEQSGDYFSYFALDNILNNNNYASYGNPPNQLQFPSTTSSTTPADQQLQAALDLGADYMTPEQSQALTPVAKSLGFASAKNFVHALRYLPEETKTRVLEGLATRSSNTDNEVSTGALKQMLKSEAHHLVYNTFEKQGARAPQLDPPLDNDPEGMWEAPHLLAIYNNFKTMEGSLPAPVVKDIMEPDNGEAMVFQRKKTPQRSGAEDNLLKSLSSAMKVAETDQQNTVTLFDSAFTANPEDIVQSEDVQSFLKAYESVKDSETSSPQVKSVQEMLNNILPADRKLPLTGVMDKPTVAILAEFEGQQFLKQAYDIFDDDKKLSSADRGKHLSDINQLQQAIFKEGYLNAQGDLNPNATELFSFVQELNKSSTNLTPASKARLNSLVSTMETRVSAKTLNPELLENVVSNWFGIIDSGERKDFAEQVITHELGHFWENKNNVISNWKQLSFQEFENEQDVGESSVPHAHSHDETMASTLEIRGEKDGFASSYAKLNSSEDFAESFRLFNRDPDKLIQKNLLKYMMLAGSMGTYAGDNAGLLDFAKKNGYSEEDISVAVETLRGHQKVSGSSAVDNTPFTQDQEAHLPVAGGSAFEPAAMHFPMSTHGHDEHIVPPSSTESLPTSTESSRNKSAQSIAMQSGFIKHGSTIAHEAEHSVSAVGKTAQGLAFDLSVANYFPGIEKDLRIESTHVGDPSKPGFMLDNLTSHTENMEKFRLFSRSSRNSHRFINDFKEKGIEAFPSEIRAKIPQSVKEKFQTPENKAIYLVMAKLRSSPELADEFSKLANKGSDQQAVSASFFKDNFGDVLDGLQVPDALVSYMSNPQNLMDVTGNGGKSLLAAETIEKNAVDVVIKHQQQYAQAIDTIAGVGKGGGVSASLTSSGYLEYDSGTGFSAVDFLKSLPLSEVNGLLSKLGFGSQAAHLSEKQFQALTEKLVQRLNQNLPKESFSSEEWTDDPATIKQINDIMLEELLREVPTLKANINRDAVG